MMLRISYLCTFLLWVALAGPAGAQQITGTPGAPNATTTIDGHVLPPPPQPFRGQIELNAAQVEARVAHARRASEGRA